MSRGRIGCWEWWVRDVVVFGDVDCNWDSWFSAPRVCVGGRECIGIVFRVGVLSGVLRCFCDDGC